MRFLTLLISIVFFNCVYAQDTLSSAKNKSKVSFLSEERVWTAELPVWVPGFAGSFTYGNVNIEGEDGVDPENPIEPPPGGDIGKIISRLFQKNWYLKFFFLTKVAYEKNNLLVQFDVISGSVGNSVKFKSNNNEIVKATFRTTNFRLFAGYKFINVLSGNSKLRYELFGYFGTRVYFQSVSSTIKMGTTKISFSPAWWEPVIGIQNQITLKKWFFVLQGDYGGLFVKNKLSGQLTFYAYYRLGRLNSIKLGWNHLQLNHTGQFAGETYNIKSTFSGPSVGLTFHF